MLSSRSSALAKVPLMALCALLALSACVASPPDITPEIEVIIKVDDREIELSLPEGSLVRDAFRAAQIEIGLLDRSLPEFSALIDSGLQIQLIRVQEIIDNELVVLPFERQVLRNEALPEGELRIVQAGQNGSAELTFRSVFENGELLSRIQVQKHVVQEPVEEIVMVGVQASASSLAITGKLAYLSTGNAWLIEDRSEMRRPLISSGDLDGRIFSLSPNGKWLLFSRESGTEDQINSLWITSTDEDQSRAINLRTDSVVHYADWIPGSNREISFSTVQTSINPPGWLANNDLQWLRINNNGRVIDRRQLLPARADSLYSWWGSQYLYSPDGTQIAYSSPDEIGLLDTSFETSTTLLEITSYQSQSEWAWLPPIAWMPDSQSLLAIQHAPQPAITNQELSPLFNLVSINVQNLELTVLIENVGMFSNPSASPFPIGSANEPAFLLAYLQAYNPSQSDLSAYQLVITDTGDSPQSAALFPPSGAPGLQAQPIIWSRSPEGAEQGQFLALVYQGNLWIMDALTSSIRQITGDGLVTRLDWGP